MPTQTQVQRLRARAKGVQEELESLKKEYRALKTSGGGDSGARRDLLRRIGNLERRVKRLAADKQSAS